MLLVIWLLIKSMVEDLEMLLVFQLAKKFVAFIFYFIYLFKLQMGFYLSDTTTRHNTQITHIIQNNTPHSNKTQHTKLHKMNTMQIWTWRFMIELMLWSSGIWHYNDLVERSRLRGVTLVKYSILVFTTVRNIDLTIMCPKVHCYCHCCL
jgi:hypothetical protein